MRVSADQELLFKVLVLGDSGVGKSALLRRYVDNRYDASYVSTIGVDFKIKSLVLDGDILIKLQLWDTAGQERFRSVTQSYYRGADGVFFVVDMTDLQTLRNLPGSWLHDLSEQCGSLRPEDPEAPALMLLANKADLAREAQIKDAHLEPLLMPHYKVSARTGANVERAIEDMCRAILKKRAAHHTRLREREEEAVSKRSLVHLYRSGGSSTIRLPAAAADSTANAPQQAEGGCSC